MLVFKKTQTQWRLSAQRGTIWSRTKYMVNKLIWIMNLGEFRANCTGREGQAINNLPCRGSLQITGPPLSPCLLPLLFFFPLPSVTYLLPLFFSCPSFFAFRSVFLLLSVSWLSRQTDPRGGLEGGGQACIHLFAISLSLSLSFSLWHASSQLEVVNI